MLKMLEGGILLAIMVAVFALGVLDKLLLRSLYKRLIKQSDNMQETNNHYLRQLKQKFESSYRVNAGINNTRVYIEKQLSQYHFLGVSLRGIDNFSSQAAGLTVLLGILGSLGAYWYGVRFEYIVLYTCTGIVLGIAAYMWDNLLDAQGCREDLTISLCDYFQNILLCQLRRYNYVVEEKNEEKTTQKVKPIKDQSAKDIEYLKKSLNQIAAGREVSVTSEANDGKLGLEEEKVIKEILKEYFS